MEELLTSGQPLLIFLEEPPGSPGPRLSALGQAWLGMVTQAVQEGIISDATLVPVAIAYDLVPDAPCNMNHVRPGVRVDINQFWVAQYVLGLVPLGLKSDWDVKCLKNCPYSHYPTGSPKVFAITILQKTP